jgi:protein-disulfide isomerase
MPSRLDTVLSAGIAVAALVTAVAVVHREFGPRQFANAIVAPPTLDAEWRHLLPAARLVAGDSTAPVQLVEFGDFECPFCRHFEEAFQKVEQEHRSEVALWFIHFPLDMHKFAKLAAHAAECAGAVGDFNPMSRVLFAKQDSFGLKPWGEYAVEAGVSDIAGFESCFQNPSTMARVDSGLAEGTRFAVRATPTILINGWRYSEPPSDSLNDIIERILSGGSP